MNKLEIFPGIIDIANQSAKDKCISFKDKFTVAENKNEKLNRNWYLFVMKFSLFRLHNFCYFPQAFVSQSQAPSHSAWSIQGKSPLSFQSKVVAELTLEQ